MDPSLHHLPCHPRIQHHHHHHHHNKGPPRPTTVVVPPPVVKSSVPSCELSFDEGLIDSLIGTPNKIHIPERYVPEEQEPVEPEEEQKRTLKAERICRLLSKGNAGGFSPLVLPPPPVHTANNHNIINKTPLKKGVINGGLLGKGSLSSSHSHSVPSSPARLLVAVKKSGGSNHLHHSNNSLQDTPRRGSGGGGDRFCDWSLAGVIPPTGSWSRGGGNTTTATSSSSSSGSLSASERLFGAAVPPAFGIGDHSPIPYEKGVVIGGTKVDYFKASVHHHQVSGSSQSSTGTSTSGRSSASAEREDLLHLQQYLAREVTEKSRVVAIKALSSATPNNCNRSSSPWTSSASPPPPSPSVVQQQFESSSSRPKHIQFSTSQMYRDPSPPSPVELPTVQQREGFFT